MTDQKIEIELELQDKAASVVKDISTSVSDLVKHLNQVTKDNSGGESGINKTSSNIKRLGDNAKDSSKHLDGIAASLRSLAGAAGTLALVGGALYSVANQLNNFAVKKLQLNALSIDIGFTTKEISRMTRTFELMGSSAESSKQQLVSIGGVLRDLKVLGEGSDVFRSLSFHGFNDIAKKLFVEMNSGSAYQAFLMVIEQYNKLEETDKRSARLFLSFFPGLTESMAKNFAERTKLVKDLYQTNTEAMQEFHNRWETISEGVDDMVKRKQFKFMGMSLDIAKFFENFGFSKEQVAPQPFDLKKLPDTFSDRFGNWKELEETKKEGSSTLEKIRDSIKNLFGFGSSKQHGGSVEAGQNYLIGEDGPELFQGGGNMQVVGEGGPSIIQFSSPGMIMAGGREEYAGFPQFMPNIHTPQVAMPPFEERFGDWNSKGFNDRFGEWNSKGFGERYGDWSTSGGGTRPTDGYSTPNWKGGDWQGDGFSPSMGSDISSIERRQLDIMLSAESGEAPSLNADITFKNVPAGVMTKADGDGFDNFKVNKSRSLEDM